ncbi:MAG: hypothetical protein IPH59_03290 [bacterium]|nr:hypothetical protein [bacterium]
MNRKSLVYLFMSSLLAGLLIVGCGSEDDGPVGGVDTEVVVEAVSTAPNLTDIVNDPVWDDVDVASIRFGADSTYTDYFGVGVVRIQAIQDGDNVYMRFNWSDSSKTEKPARWIFARPGGSDAFSQVMDTAKNKFGNFAYSPAEREQQLWENEDVLSIFFEAGTGGSVGANCALTCHSDIPKEELPTHYTQGNGNIDCWIWRAGRTEPFGVAEDYYWRDNGKVDGDSAVTLYRRNARSESVVTEPRVMHTTGRNFTGDILNAVDTMTFQLVDQGWVAGDGIPGYVYYPEALTTNSSRYDVKSMAEYDPQLGRWNLVLWRALAAPNGSEDVTFTAGQSYEATLAIMRNTLQRHSGTQPFTIKF